MDTDLHNIKRAAVGGFSHADYIYEKLIEEFKDYQDDLSDNEELAIMLSNLGSTNVMIVTDIGFANPDLLYFYGLVDGVPSQLIQHKSQLNFLLTSVKKPDSSKPARRMGFTVD